MVRRRSQRASALVREAMVRDVHGDEIVLFFQHAAHVNMFPRPARPARRGVHEVLGGSWRFRAELGGDDSGRPGNARPAATSPGSTSQARRARVWRGVRRPTVRRARVRQGSSRLRTTVRQRIVARRRRARAAVVRAGSRHRSRMTTAGRPQPGSVVTQRTPLRRHARKRSPAPRAVTANALRAPRPAARHGRPRRHGRQ